MTIKKSLDYLYNITGVSFGYIHDGTLLHTLSPQPYAEKIAVHLPDILAHTQQNANCVLTDDLLCYGMVRIAATGGMVVVGPVATMPCNKLQAQRILRSYGLPPTDDGELLALLQSSPIMTIGKFIKIVSFLNYELNDEEIEHSLLLPSEYQIVDDEPIESGPAMEFAVHDGRDYENLLFSLIRYGQYKKLCDFLRQTQYAHNEGVLAGEIKRHRKNLVICSTTLAARCAVGGGVDYDTAMTLADSYIQKVELVPDYETLAALNKHMMKKFCKMVSDRKINNAHSALASKVRNHMELHITEPVTVTDIADAIGVSRAYLSTQFKKETGINLNDYINEIKIDEAKRLLTITKYSNAEIGSILSFSTNSFFNATFKKVTGMTPKEFKKSLIIEL